MPTEAARKEWLREQLAKADYCHLGAWGSNDTYDVQGDLEDLLAECETLRIMLKEQSDAAETYYRGVKELEADKRALVAYVHVYGKYVREWMEHMENEADYPDFAPVEEAWQALGAELQEEINDRT